MTLALLLLALFCGVAVEVSFPDGTSASGELNSLSRDALRIAINGTDKAWPTEQVRRLRFSTIKPVVASSPSVQLTDGTVLMANRFQLGGDVVQFVWPDGDTTIKLGKRAIKAMQYVPLSDARLAQWNEWIAHPPTADVLVVQRKDQQLQAIEGLIESVTDDNVRFQFDGDTLDVKLAKVVGMLIYSGGNQTTVGPRGVLTTVGGSSIRMNTCELKDGRFELQSVNGSSFTLPLDRVLDIDFAAVSTAYLSELEPEKSQWSGQLRIPALEELEQKWFAPQNDRRLSRAALEIDGPDAIQTIPKGLGLHSRTELTYRLAGEYRRFLARASMDLNDGESELVVVLLTDGKEVLRQTLRTSSAPIDIDVDVSRANRLTVLIDFGDSSDFGDHVSLCDARLLK